MPINRHKKILFVHIPKNAGSSVAKTLDMKADWKPKNLDVMYGIDENQVVLQSLPLEYFSNYIDQKLIDECQKITVVRNPYDRVLSDYTWSKRGFSTILDFLKFIKQNINKDKKELIKLNKYYTNHILPQSEYIKCEKNKIDKIFYFETLNEDFFDFYGIKLLHINSRKHKEWKEFYKNKPEEIQLINELYDQDFKNFGYEKLESKNFG